MALVWVYQGNDYRRVDDLSPSRVLMMITNGCDSIKPLINYVLSSVLNIQEHGGMNVRVYRGSDDALLHFSITVGNGNREVIIIVSRNPADTLFNYYTSSGENIINCNFGN